MNGKLFMVIPPVVRLVNDRYEVEADFANNLSAYLRSFEHVTVACPASPNTNHSGIIRSVPLAKISGYERSSYIALPYAYREDRYFLYYWSIKKRLRSEISKANFLLFSPHANYDWSTLAAELAIQMNRKFDMEADWDGQSVVRLWLKEMPFGIRKIRKALMARSFSKRMNICFSHSAVALLQGQDVYNAYKDVAPNPRKVLNVQVSKEDQISSSLLAEKLTGIRAGKPLTICYAGRMIEMKGPLDWLAAIHGACQAGVDLHATWFGDGPMMAEMRHEVQRQNIGANVALPGVVGRQDLLCQLWKTDIFLFCHKTGESPRCLGEALAAGCPLVGYDRAYPRDLVAKCGGGEFVQIGDSDKLADAVIALDRNRQRLEALVKAAAASGALLDRDTAMQERIELIKAYAG